MTREQYLKHKKVMDWFYNQPEGTEVWYKNDNEWAEVRHPTWFLGNTYVINDKYAELRKEIVELEEKLNKLKRQIC